MSVHKHFPKKIRLTPKLVSIAQYDKFIRL